MSGAVMQSELWKPQVFTAGSCRMWEIGPLRFWVRRTKGEWHVAFKHDESEEDRLAAAVECEPPEDLKWARWAVNDNYTELRLHPVLPNRPVIVRPEVSMHVLPGETVKYYIGVPFWIALGRGAMEFLCDLPTRILSNSWFGDPTQGELCFASFTKARRAMDDSIARPFRAISVLQVRNGYHEPLPIDRICLRVPYLNIYQGDRYLWTSEQRIVYRGPLEVTKLVISRSGSNEDKAEEQIGFAREHLKRGLFTPSLGTLTPVQY